MRRSGVQIPEAAPISPEAVPPLDHHAEVVEHRLGPSMIALDRDVLTLCVHVTSAA